MNRISFNKMLATILSVILVLCMLSSYQPAYAEEEDEWEGFPSGFRITESSKPGKPAITLETCNDITSVNIIISRNEYTSGYEIMMKAPGAKKFKKIKTLKKEGQFIQSYTVKNLKEGTYSFKVRGYLKYNGKTVKGEYSNVRDITLENTGIPDIGEVKTGDVVQFGAWEQDEDKDGKEPLEWIVLSNKDSKLFLLSRHVIAADNMNGTYGKKVTWKKSSLRKWLNDSFINTAFDSEQAGFIASTKLKDVKTTDKVFLLSKDEVTKEEYGLSSNLARIGTVSHKFPVWTCNYAYYFPEHSNACFWWLRTNKKGKFSAVSCGGDVCDGVRCYFDYYDDDFEYFTGHYCEDDYEEVTLEKSNLGIRPALVVDLAALKSAGKDSLITVKGERIKAMLPETPAPVVERETITFGSYDQDNNQENGAEPIEWYVLSKTGTEMTLLSKYVLDCQPFATDEEQDKYDKVFWEMSSIRRWLNDDFYNTAFSKDEQNRIKLTKLKNSDDRYYNSDNGNDTEDKVFLPTALDMLNPDYGFNYDESVNDIERRCAATAYALEKGVWGYDPEDPAEDAMTTSGELACQFWWLRSKGYDLSGCWSLNIYFAAVGNYGAVSFGGDPLWYDICGVRPMIVVSLKDE
ncbi:MAG: hypothetical protein IK071_08205 [Lachnospiraceae bacterium]|nr:hypothetical protein [Lachnospiraceae bacterium]